VLSDDTKHNEVSRRVLDYVTPHTATKAELEWRTVVLRRNISVIVLLVIVAALSMGAGLCRVLGWCFR